MHMLLILFISFLGLVFIPKTQGLSIAQLSDGSETGSGDVSISFTTISVASTTTTTTATTPKAVPVFAYIIIVGCLSLVAFIYQIYKSYVDSNPTIMHVSTCTALAIALIKHFAKMLTLEEDENLNANANANSSCEWSWNDILNIIVSIVALPAGLCIAFAYYPLFIVWCIILMIPRLIFGLCSILGSPTQKTEGNNSSHISVA